MRGDVDLLGELGRCCTRFEPEFIRGLVAGLVFEVWVFVLLGWFTVPEFCLDVTLPFL
jgi:hypothetical protein